MKGLITHKNYYSYLRSLGRKKVRVETYSQTLKRAARNKWQRLRREKIKEYREKMNMVRVKGSVYE